MGVTAADVLRVAPEFASLDATTVITPAISDALLELSAAAWGTLYDRATALLAAHLLSVYHPEFYRGGVQSETVGPVSRTYAVVAPSLANLSTSRFGVELTALRRQLGLGLAVI